MKPLNVNGVLVMPGSKSYELLTSKDKEDNAKGKRMLEYTRKAAEANYEFRKLEKLRKEFKDVL